MKLRSSFGIRMALLSAAISGLVLVVFGTSALALIRRMQMESMERDIKGRLHPVLTRRQNHPPWESVEQSLRFSFGEGRHGDIVLCAFDRMGNQVYRSPDWPGAISLDSLPAVTEVVTPENSPGPVRGMPDETNDRRPPRPGTSPPQYGPGPRSKLPTSSAVFVTRSAGDRQWRIGVMGNAEERVVVGFDMSRLTAQLLETSRAFLIPLPAALLLIAAGALLTARRALRPVAALTRTAERITGSGLDQRIALTEADEEFTRLITVFNAMLDRLQRSFEQATRFSADAAHELKTPLTILQGRLEEALREAEAGSPQQLVAGELLEEVQRLKTIVHKLLLLSAADSGRLKLDPEPFDLTAAVEELYDDMLILAPGLSVTKQLQPGVQVLADNDLMQQVLHNLSSNAIKYTPEGGSIALHLCEQGGKVRLAIANTANSLQPLDREQVFDRFYRADKSRSRAGEGVGLGLNLAREILRAHKGDLVLEDADESMITFVLILPKPGPSQIA